MLQVDPKNAYNSLKRTAIFRGCARYCPALLGAVLTAYECETDR